MGDIAQAVIDGLQKGVQGDVCRAGDAGYDEAVNIWNGAIDRRPAVVVRCATSADVAVALAFARRQGARGVGARRRSQLRRLRALPTAG